MLLNQGGVGGIGFRRKISQCGADCGIVPSTDASAALGVCVRQGAGKQKHLSAKQQRAQEMEARVELTTAKAPREEHSFDLLTLYWTKPDGER